jgi:hypothetical protein
MATIAYRLVGDDLMLFVCGDASPSDSEWQEYIRFMEELTRRMRTSSNALKLLVFADNGGLTPKQRASVVEVLRGVSTRTAVVSTSMVARNLITAFGWLNFAVRGFAPNQLDQISEYLDLPAGHISEVMAAAASMAPSIGGVRCVDRALLGREAS